MRNSDTYKIRFENLFRIAHKITSSLNIGDILETIRDEAKVSVPKAREACLLMFDKEAMHYTRPLHCAVHKERINCQLCKRGRKTIRGALSQPLTYQCSYASDGGELPESGKTEKAICEVSLPISNGTEPVAVLNVIAKEECFFDQDDLMLLEDLADLATNSIANARNHWRVSREKLTIDKVLEHLSPFVPATVKRIVEKNPFEPSLQKRETDVSIMFLDVAGYTKISQSLSEEKVNFIIEKYFSGFLDVIYAHGGDINETAGDGLMVIFKGQPQESALNACRAALEISRKTSEINDELEGRFEPIHVNTGINSGKASVGMTRFDGATGKRMTYTATGPVTNLAARIASAAVDGDILVGPETAKRIKNRITIFDRGSMKFKNVMEPVHVFSLLRPS
jgi:class 3 adenylate cyclase